MSKQEIINDVLFLIGRVIIKTPSFTLNKALKTFKTTRLNEYAPQYTQLALVQIHRDLSNLLASHDAVLFKEEIEWLENRANALSKGFYKSINDVII